MKIKKLTPSVRSNLNSIFIGVLVTILCLKIILPILDWLVDILIRFLSVISKGFKDVIYTEAVKGFHESLSVDITLQLHGAFILIGSFILVTLYALSFELSKEVEESFITIKRKFVKSCIILVTLMVLLSLAQIQTVYISKVATKSFISIDIIAPFIEPKEHLSLKSDFLRIKNAEDYEAFYRNMVELSTKHEIELPLFKPL